MIGYIEGRVITHNDDSVMVLTAGIGYVVIVAERVRSQLPIGQEAALFTHQHVREDALDLYGFVTQSDLQFFKQLIQVSGVGPRLAQAMLAAYTAEELRGAIASQDVTVLSSVSGVGKKTAERIVLDLKDRVAVMVPGTGAAGMAGGGAEPSAVEALVALGYAPQEAVAALRNVDTSQSVEDQIKEALQQ